MLPRTQDIWIQRLKIVGLLLLGGLFLLVLFRTAWLCDDAYITYRTVDNFVNGYGLTFNPAERVQSFTHPLWMLVHIPFYAAGIGIYDLGIGLSILVSLLALGWMCWKIADSVTGVAFALLAMTFSWAFMDYSTSGLENPMTHLLLALFLGVYFRQGTGRKKLFYLTLITGLALMNRLDTVLMFAPVLALEFWRMRSWRHLKTVIVGLSPFLLWEAFAVIYYGFVLPNTAYAKLNLGLDAAVIWEQGLQYFMHTLRNDPLTMLVIFAGILLPFVLRRKRLYPLAIGLILYNVYIVRIGGDFMGGRFYTGPFFLAVGILLQIELRLSRLAEWTIPALPVILGLLATYPTILNSADYGKREGQEVFYESGIADERAYYYHKTGLLNMVGHEIPDLAWVRRGLLLRDKGKKTLSENNMGFTGFFAGPDIHLVDVYALTDPLLSRLPNVYRPNWRVGHYSRIVPQGYMKSVAEGNNQVVDPDLHKLYERIRLVTRGPLFSMDRLKAIFDFNVIGNYRKLVDRDRYHLPEVLDFSLSTFENLPVDGVEWNAPGHVRLSMDKGMRVTLPKRPFSEVSIHVHPKCSWTILFRTGDEILEGMELDRDPKHKSAMKNYVLSPKNAETGNLTDNLLIYPNNEGCCCTVGKLSLRK